MSAVLQLAQNNRHGAERSGVFLIKTELPETVVDVNSGMGANLAVFGGCVNISDGNDGVFRNNRDELELSSECLVFEFFTDSR